MEKFARFCVAAISAIALAACGGGGGGGTSTSTPTTTTTTTTTVTSVTGNAAYAPTDPLFADQWHLKNTGQKGADNVAGTAGEDLNVEKVWTSFKGTGVRIAIVDDGLDIVHEDLSPNAVLADSWDYTTVAAPVTNLITGNSAHGTACGGLAAAAGGNSKGGVGVAMAAKLVGYNLLQAASGANEADAMTRGASTNSVSSNSWGATDGTGTLQPSASAWQTAINTGIATGRSNKGIVYAWAAGNGAPVDRSDYDGQANYAGVIAVAALNDKGQKSSYSEPGSNILVSAYGGEFCSTHTLTTTDITGAAGANTAATAGVSNYTDTNYTKCMNGTSGATPEVSGAVALLLEANPALTFRDVRIILATTARKNDATDAGWGVNGATTPLHINEKYGYGAVDAQAAVNAALTWTSVGGASTLVSKTGSNPITTPLAIADGTGTASSPVYGTPTTSTITITGSSISKIEFVDINVTSNHTYYGDLKITITSPRGTVSTLSNPRTCNNGTTAVACGSALSSGFRFGVARLINEAADGTWILSVSDGSAADTGSLSSWNITVYGH